MFIYVTILIYMLTHINILITVPLYILIYFIYKHIMSLYISQSGGRARLKS